MITKEQLESLYSQDLSLDEIGRQLGGLNRSLVTYYLRKFGFPKRNKSPQHRKIGDKVGEWSLIEATKTKGRTYWLCECSCGVRKVVEAASLNKGGSASCWECSMKKVRDTKLVPTIYWHKIRLGASRRQISFTLTEDYLIELWQKQNGLCALSNQPICFAQTRSQWNQRKTTASLDRIRSDLGYEVGNVQWVHKDVNNAKQAMTETQFIAMCIMVAKHKGVSHAGSSEVSDVGEDGG
jgi:hypothetical protein